MSRGPHKFHPSKAAKLESPERQRFLPNETVVRLLELDGSETVVDYGAGTGVLSVPVAQSVPEGTVYAVDESPEMIRHLQERLTEAALPNVRPLLTSGNRVDLESGSADRVLAVNVLHEVVGENALAQMHRLLRPDGFLLAIDWRADVEHEQGPPAEISLTPEQGRQMLEEAGFDVRPAREAFPYHFSFVARPKRA